MVDSGFEDPWLRGGIGNRVAEQLELARTLYEGGQIDIDTICATLGIPDATLYRYLTDRAGEPSAASCL